MIHQDQDNIIFLVGIRKSDTPGPGQYHIPCAIVDVNDYTRESGKFDPNFRYI